MKVEQLFNKKVDLQKKPDFDFPYSLSEEYLDFIRNYDIKNIIRRDGKIRLDTGKDNDFVGFYDLIDKESLININKHFYTVDVDDVLKEAGLVIIGETSAGSVFVCIGTLENNFGQIFIYGWDLGIIKIAENLQDFFDSLETDGTII